MPIPTCRHKKLTVVRPSPLPKGRGVILCSTTVALECRESPGRIPLRPRSFGRRLHPLAVGPPHGRRDPCAKDEPAPRPSGRGLALGRHPTPWPAPPERGSPVHRGGKGSSPRTHSRSRPLHLPRHGIVCQVGLNSL